MIGYAILTEIVFHSDNSGFQKGVGLDLECMHMSRCMGNNRFFKV